MKNYSFLIIGGDQRQQHLYSSLLAQSMDVKIVFDKPTEDLDAALAAIPKADVVVLPIPVSSDKVHLFAPNAGRYIPLEKIAEQISPDSLVFTGGYNAKISLCRAKKVVNLLDDEVMTLNNAMATAEAALSILIKKTQKTVFGAKAVVIGYGRIGKILSTYLTAMHCFVTVCARREESRTIATLDGCNAIGFAGLEKHLPQANMIINTVPSPVIGKAELSKICQDALILDLASKPGGVDFEAAKALGIEAIHALSLPGKFSPKSAAKYIEDTIMNTLT